MKTSGGSRGCLGPAAPWVSNKKKHGPLIPARGAITLDPCAASRAKSILDPPVIHKTMVT